MIKNDGFCDPEVALRQICAAPAAVFGAQLLAEANGAAIPFRAFVQAARRLVTGSPDDAARWLAAMVALDMVEKGRRFEGAPGLEPGFN